MITVNISNETHVLDENEKQLYYIQHEYYGRDQLVFYLPSDSEQLKFIENEIQVYETTENQFYLIKSIDRGSNSVKIIAYLDLDPWKSKLYKAYTNASATAFNTISGVKPSGWTVIDNSGVTIRRTIEFEGTTAWEIVERVFEVYKITARVNNNSKIITLINPKNYQPSNVYFTEDLNLRKLSFKGKTTDFATRLYAVGSEGLTFADINSGKDYVDNFSYSDKVVVAFWKDDRYTDKSSLLADATAKLETMAVPEQSYECDVIDIAKIDPENYSFLGVSLFKVVALKDKIKNKSINHQIVEERIYPNAPDKNVITLSTVPKKLQSEIKSLQSQIDSVTGNFTDQMQAMINSFGDLISGNTGGNMVITYNTGGKPNGIKIMDTADETTAQKILWFNLNGITYSGDGGQNYSSVWSFAQGGFIANWLVAGTINANLVNITNLIVDHYFSQNGSYTMEQWAAVSKWFESGKLRLNHYITGSTDSTGISQYFKGNIDENGNLLDSTSRYSNINAEGLSIGERKDGSKLFDVDSSGNVTIKGNSTIGNVLTINKSVDIAGKGQIISYDDSFSRVGHFEKLALANGSALNVNWQLINIGGINYRVLTGG